MPSELLTQREGDTLVLTLSDPATRNTLSPQVYSAGVEALNVAADDATLRAVIIRGDGEHFCAGGDLNRIASARERPPQLQAESIEQFCGLVEALGHFPKPVIAAVEGFAAGGGMALALACDLIVAASDARFVMSYAKLGLSPDGGASWHLARALPRALALELMWLAEPISAQRLHALGLVNRLTEKGQALAAALALARQLAGMAPNAVASSKELVQQAPARRLREQMEAEKREFVANLFHDNGGEGIAAFQAKRKPEFR
ncbi:MAG TPA: enoyl-CoA hydratase [Ideonella sp.]|uniref:oxepin-CoA hydrolase, alternative type n=1 Tax=Ideonella sp. TaxID=1929293 RepID=UPI002CD2B074|nr:enoyl-CoA hydratase [Ideonella sp.]HSI50959.1 enoyl-CoA hydratase [Ideonella sp.]